MIKTLFVISAVVFLIIGCDYYKQKDIEREKRFYLAEKCSASGKIYFDEFRSGFGSIGRNYMWDDPEYHYSSKLNTCLIHIRYVDQSFALSSLKVSYQYNQVIDIFSNKVILYGYFERSVDNNTEKTIDTFHANIPNYTSIEYFKHKDKLFSE